MTTSYLTDPAPKLTPVLDGKKVVFSREEPKTDEAEKPAEQPKQAEKSKAADGKS